MEGISFVIEMESTMKTFFTIIVTILTALVSQNLKAASYVDLDNYPGLDGTPITLGTSLTGFFEIGIDQYDGEGGDGTGYDATSETIIRADVSFTLTALIDGNFVVGTVNIFLGADAFRLSNGAFTIDAGDFAFGDVEGTALFDLQEDGILRYTITPETDGLGIIEARLNATSGPRSVEPPSVPDVGNPMLLLGFAVVALGFLKRRLSA